jgi:hypothetical protein
LRSSGGGGGGEEGGGPADIKSNNPHLTGGEKHVPSRFPQIVDLPLEKYEKNNPKKTR